MKAKVVFEKGIPLQDLGNGMWRRVLAYNEQQMIAEMHFVQGGVGKQHSHPHVQCTYVKSGKFRFTIDGEDVEVAEGDSIAFPPDVTHGTLCLEAGVLVEVFTPMRKDFI